ncbi:MAG: T9SS type A sorting domain-containing protein, partial [Bacteroidota bacterium]
QANEKLLNEIILEHQLEPETTWSESTIERLVPIASQCPLEGGKVVYLARSLYNHIDPYRYFRNDCSGNVALQSAAHEQEIPVFSATDGASHSNVWVYPNPVSGILHLELALSETGTFELLNHLGQVVKVMTLSNDLVRWQISTSDLPGGMYTYRIIYDNEVQHTDKVIIQH